MEPLSNHPSDAGRAVPEPPLSRPARLRSLAASLLAALAFGLAYSQAPLYTSNQNQYFLHGAARAGLGFLNQDWLANTADPTPVFSLIVEWTYRFLSPAAFYIEYLVLLAVYLAALWLLADRFFSLRTSGLRPLVFLTLVILLHSAALRWAQSRLLGEGWEYLWDGGLAGQRLLGDVFQPSTFGVLLLLSVALFARGRPAWACALAALAACVHPTYLLSAALLVLAYLLLEWRRTRSLLPPFRIGLLALLLVTPTLLYVALVLGPTSPDHLAEAQRILVEARIPHHALPAVWLDASSLAQMVIVASAFIATRRTPIARLLLLVTTAGLLLTAVQVLTGSAMLALLFPWRISAVLVPASTALLAGWVATRLAPVIERHGARARRAARLLSVIVIILLAAAGALAFLLLRSQQSADPAWGVMTDVKAHAATGDVYLVPARLQEFRLVTGAPVVVDFKSIPYRDVDVLEWYERLRLVDFVYREEPQDVNCALLDQAAQRYGVTHVVLDGDLLDLDCPQLHIVHADDRFALGALTVPR